MLDEKQLEHDPQGVLEKLERRGALAEFGDVIVHLSKRKQLVASLQLDQERRNAESKALGQASKSDIDSKRAELKQLSQTIKERESELRDVEAVLQGMLLRLPNIPRDDVPSGTSADDNVEARRWGTPKSFSFPVLDHVELGERLGILDFARAAKISGARFTCLRGIGSKLNRALMQWMTDFHVEKGDLELTPPYLVREAAMVGVGQLPKFQEDAFRVAVQEGESMYLIPTAEVPVTYFHSQEILDEESLPIRMCAYTPCFRAEAGAAGRDTRGLIRLHQFEKVEMVRLATAEQAEAEHEAMVKRAEEMLQALELPYRVMTLCTGDLGLCSEKTYDLEVWVPAQNCYREISSCSSFGSYQARRSQIRYRHGTGSAKAGKIDYVATLNGSGLPLGRTLVAILENHQQADGSVLIPKVLRPYMGGMDKVS